MSDSVAGAAEEIGGRTLRDLEELSRMSASPVGVTRLAYSAEDFAAKEWFRVKCQAGGLEFDMDQVGNCFAWTPNAKKGRPVMMGSHLDSVIDGGRFDGTLGVVLGLELATHFAANGSDLPMCVVNFAAEESTRFGFGPVGSRALFGELPKQAFADVIDRDGERLSEILQRTGLSALTAIEVTAAAARQSCCYLEAHIDQGTMLSAAGLSLGVVTTIAGIGRTSIRWSGEAAHSGARYHLDRRDALLAASSFVTAADEIWTELEDPAHTLAVTIGQFDVHPNSPNTVPGRVDLILDVRSDTLAVVERATTALCSAAREIGAHRRVDVHPEAIGLGTPVSMNNELTNLLEERARAGGITASKVVSLSGHDAMVVAPLMPTAMILLRNPSGISHSPDESVDEQSIVRSCELLLDALPRMWETFAPAG
jgi:beta-ureidopropionase / N-carbamoyl-L-amino-acid hydrolase